MKDWKQAKPKTRKVPLSISREADSVVLAWLANKKLNNYNQAINDIILFTGTVEAERERKKLELLKECQRWRINPQELV